MSLRSWIKGIGRVLNRCIPKREDQILFESNSDYCDNSRALYDYMQAAGYGEHYRFVWCVSDVRRPPAGLSGAELVSFRSRRGFLRYFLTMARSGHVVFSHYAPPFVNPKGQQVLNLWHGTPLKTLKGHVPPASLFSALLSPSDLFDPILAESFGAAPEQLVQCGYPRNDLLFHPKDSLARLGIDPAGWKKVLLWMPTFRRPADGSYQDGAATSTGLPLIETPALLEELNARLTELGLYLMIKLHPGQDLSGVKLVELSSIRMLTNRELDEAGVELYRLVGAADGLLTDYSSIYFDYLLLNHPMIFLIDDIDGYQENRGFTVAAPLSLMPGEKVRAAEELYQALGRLARGEDAWEGERARVNGLVNRFTDDQSARRTAERFFPEGRSGHFGQQEAETK